MDRMEITIYAKRLLRHRGYASEEIDVGLSRHKSKAITRNRLESQGVRA